MYIEIDPHSEVPLYQQLRDRLVEAIAAGAVKPGDQLASVRQVASQFGINVATVGKGYELLRQEGLVRTSRRSGSTVARGPELPPADGFGPEWTGRLTTVLAEGLAQGLTGPQIQERVAAILTEFRPRRGAEGMPS